MFDLNRLRLFRELARLQTMTAVAAKLSLTSSAVSQQLAILEEEAGTRLLERIGRQVRLTPEGLRLLHHAETIIQSVDDGERAWRATDSEEGSRLDIACFSTFAKIRLVPALKRIRAHFKTLDIVLHEMETPDAIDAVRNGRCHIAVVFEYNLVPRSNDHGLTVHDLVEEPVLLAVPGGLARKRLPPLERLADAAWIVGSRQSDDRILAQRLCALAGFEPRMTHEVDDYDLLLKLVSADLGIGLIPQSALQSSNTKGVVAGTPGGQPLLRRIRALTRASLSDSRAVQRLLSEIG
jgi:DNA-binding transcriptional LysR family regulator